MILVASPSKPFTYTAKATARRQAIIADYNHEIDALYKAVTETTKIDVILPEDWELFQTVQFVRDVVKKVLMKGVDDEDDIFQHGCDRCLYFNFAIARHISHSSNFQPSSDMDQKLHLAGLAGIRRRGFR
jgi:hypothetical protein